MIKNLAFFLLLSLSFLACNNTPEPTAVTEEGQFFGEKITLDNAMEFDSFVSKMETQDSMNVKVTGIVESVCKKKGCWANIKSETTGKELFVKFKDYGFFLPLDCEGQKVTLEGVAFREVTSVDELRHYAEDEGASKEEIEAITEPKEELKIIASGAALENTMKQQKN